MKQIGISIFIAFCSLWSLSATTPDCKDQEISRAVSRMMRMYPASTLQDLYKSFFQDRFGPGHLISDTAMAAGFLRSEVVGMTASDSLPLVEPTGYDHRFYRVNLSVIRDSVVRFPVFFDAFVRSISEIELPALADWNKEWSCIEDVIDRMQLNVPGYDADKERLSRMLQSGEYVVHHSDTFLQNYPLHYRIISRDIVEQEWGIRYDKQAF